MQMTRMKQTSSFILPIVLIAAMALLTTGCKDDTTVGDSDSSAETTIVTMTEASESPESADANVLGTGETQFTFVVADKEGTEETFEIHTDQTTVGDALLELKLIDGDEGEYGLYVKTVNGITADYDTDGTYWAFYIDGEYASTGVDMTEITENSVYTFQVEGM